MKAKKLNKKLTVVKETIVNLQESQLGDIRGGEVRTTLQYTVCKTDCATNCMACF